MGSILQNLARLLPGRKPSDADAKRQRKLAVKPTKPASRSPPQINPSRRTNPSYYGDSQSDFLTWLQVWDDGKPDTKDRSTTAHAAKHHSEDGPVGFWGKLWNKDDDDGHHHGAAEHSKDHHHDNAQSHSHSSSSDHPSSGSSWSDSHSHSSHDTGGYHDSGSSFGGHDSGGGFDSGGFDSGGFDSGGGDF